MNLKSLLPFMCELSWNVQKPINYFYKLCYTSWWLIILKLIFYFTLVLIKNQDQVQPQQHVWYIIYINIFQLYYTVFHLALRVLLICTPEMTFYIYISRGALKDVYSIARHNYIISVWIKPIIKYNIHILYNKYV